MGLSSDHTIDTYRSNRLLQLASERLLEIAGEALNAAAQIEPDVRKHIPEFGQVVGLRNRIIHGYDLVDDQIIWDSIQSDVPQLIAALERALSSSPFER